MDQNAVVSEQTESGRRLVDALDEAGFDVRVAFWAKPSEEEKWYLYIASPSVDEEGPAAAYRLALEILRQRADVWIDPMELKMIGLKDTMARASLDHVTPKSPPSPYAAQNPRPYPALTRFGGSTLGGVEVDGAYIYAPRPVASS